MAQSKTTSVRFCEEAMECITCLKNRGVNPGEAANAALLAFYRLGTIDQNKWIKTFNDTKVQKDEVDDVD